MGTFVLASATDAPNGLVVTEEDKGKMANDLLLMIPFMHFVVDVKEGCGSQRNDRTHHRYRVRQHLVLSNRYRSNVGISPRKPRDKAPVQKNDQ